MFSHNSFTRDSNPDRVIRLQRLGEQITAATDEFYIPDRLKEWAVNSCVNFRNADSAFYFAVREKDNARLESLNADSDLLGHYQKCKNILFSHFKDDDRLSMFGISGASPIKHNDITAAAALMLKAGSELTASGEENILPETFSQKLSVLLAGSIEKYYLKCKSSEAVLKSKRVLNEIFQTDSRNLRLIYNLVTGITGAEDPDLILFGFAIDNKKRGRKSKRKSVEENNGMEENNQE